jgi:MYXO-CTERM domain-containing protein
VLEPEDLDDDDGDDGVDPLDDVSARGGGCACEIGAAYGPSRSAGWAMLGLAVVAAATRRRRAR